MTFPYSATPPFVVLYIIWNGVNILSHTFLIKYRWTIIVLLTGMDISEPCLMSLRRYLTFEKANLPEIRKS